MPSYNHVAIMGNLTRDIELRYTPSGTAVCDVGIAINERIKRGEEWVDEAVFVDVTLWGRTAEVANEYLRKGSPVFIDGRLKLESWETEDGQKRSRLKVVGDRLQLLGSRQDLQREPTQPQTNNATVSSSSSYGSSDPDDEAPF